MRENLPFDDFVKKQFSDYSPDVPKHVLKNIMAKRRSKPKGFWMTVFNSKNILLLTLILLVGGGLSYILLLGENTPPVNVTTGKNNPSQTVITSPGSNQENNVTATPGETTPLNNQSTHAEKNSKGDIPDESPVNTNNSSSNNYFTPSSQKNKVKPAVYKNAKGEANSDEDFSVIQNNSTIANNIGYSPFRFNNARELNGTKSISSLNIKLPDCPAIEKNAAGNKRYWEVYAGPDYAFENYKSYGDTASANYLEKRKASTKFSSAFSAGVRYTKVFNNGTSVRAGVNYTQVNEKFVYFNPNEIKYVTVITTRVVIRAPGDTIYINDTLQYQQTGTRTKTTFNRYRNIDIPLVIGYELGNGKIHANINAGVIINIYSWYKGDVLDSLYQPVTITTGKGNSIYQFKNNIGVGFIGSVSLYYRMTDNMRLVLEPYFRYNLSPMSKQNLNLQQKYNIAGLRAGVRFDLK